MSSIHNSVLNISRSSFSDRPGNRNLSRRHRRLYCIAWSAKTEHSPISTSHWKLTKSSGNVSNEETAARLTEQMHVRVFLEDFILDVEFVLAPVSTSRVRWKYSRQRNQRLEKETLTFVDFRIFALHWLLRFYAQLPDFNNLSNIALNDAQLTAKRLVVWKSAKILFLRKVDWKHLNAKDRVIINMQLTIAFQC